MVISCSLLVLFLLHRFDMLLLLLLLHLVLLHVGLLLLFLNDLVHEDSFVNTAGSI